MRPAADGTLARRAEEGTRPSGACCSVGAAYAARGGRAIGAAFGWWRAIVGCAEGGYTSLLKGQKEGYLPLFRQKISITSGGKKPLQVLRTEQMFKFRL